MLITTEPSLQTLPHFFWKRISLCGPRWPGTQYVEQAGLKLKEIYLPLIPTQMLGLKACSIILGFLNLKLHLFILCFACKYICALPVCLVPLEVWRGKWSYGWLWTTKGILGVQPQFSARATTPNCWVILYTHTHTCHSICMVIKDHFIESVLLPPLCEPGIELRLPGLYSKQVSPTQQIWKSSNLSLLHEGPTGAGSLSKQFTTVSLDPRTGSGMVVFANSSSHSGDR